MIITLTAPKINRKMEINGMDAKNNKQRLAHNIAQFDKVELEAFLELVSYRATGGSFAAAFAVAGRVLEAHGRRPLTFEDAIKSLDSKGVEIYA